MTSDLVRNSTVLKPAVHGRLIADLRNVCLRAGVPDWALASAMEPTVDKRLVQWVRHYPKIRRSDRRDLVMVGWPDPATTMYLMAGALVRNFIDARVVTVDRLLEGVDGSVLLVPNFHSDSDHPDVDKWTVPRLLPALLNRQAYGQSTVIATGPPTRLQTAYGQSLVEHLRYSARIVTHPTLEVA